MAKSFVTTFLVVVFASIGITCCAPSSGDDHPIFEGLRYLGSMQNSVNNGIVSFGSRYYISENKYNWIDAEQYCIPATSGTLLSIDTTGEDDEIHRLLKEKSKINENIWTSGAYSTREEVWKWASNGAKVVSTKWGINQPTPNDAEHGIVFTSFDKFDYELSVKPDTNEYYFICEIPLRNDTPIPCYRENDLVIVLDGSGSILPEHFLLAKTFVSLLASAFLAPSRVSLIVYSNTASIVFDLNNKLTPAEIQAAILSADHPSGSTATNLGIDAGVSQLIKNPEGVPRKMVVLTDGASDSYSATSASAKAAKAQNIKIYSVGIGNYSLRELLTIADENPAHVFTEENFEDLIQLLAPICLKVCENNQ